MKHLKHFLLTVLVALAGTPALAYDFVVDGIYYSRYGIDVLVSNSERSSGNNSNDYSGDLVIPASVTYGGKTYKVRGIDTFVFRGCDNLHSVTLPGSMAKVGSSAFAYCTSIEEVTISEGTTSIGSYAFQNCTNLRTVSIPQGLTSIDGFAFDGCSSLETISLSGISAIDYYAFRGCSSLSSVTIPATVTSICNNAFENCTGLESVTFEGTLDKIEQSVFQGCSSLASITLPEGITEIGKKTFYNCRALATVSLPESVTVIGEQAFADCKALHNINLPHNLTTVGNSAFNMCGNDLSLTIPASITSMGTYAFACGSGLTSVTIEEGLSEIGESMFDSCSGLTELTLPESITSIGKTAFQGCKGLTSITIPSLVTVIDNGTFWCCTELVEVSLPQGLTAIGQDAFFACNHLRTITLPASLQSIGGDAFLGCWLLETVYNASMLNIVHGSEGYGRVAQLAEVVYIGTAHMYDGNNTLHELEEYNWTKIPGATASNALLFINRQWDKVAGANIVSRSTDDNNWHASAVAITDAQPFYSPYDVQAERISYKRYFSTKNWQALYLPFSLNYDEWKDKVQVAYFNNVHQYDTDGDGKIDKTTIEFFTQTGGELKANTPYLVKALNTGEVTLTGTGKVLKATPEKEGYVDCMSTSRYYTISGIYQTKTDLYAKGQYAVSNGAFNVAASSAATVPPFRIYLNCEERNGGSSMAKARSMAISVDGEETTGVEGIVGEEGNGAVYDLRGIRHDKPVAPGIYIRNGKKTVIR